MSLCTAHKCSYQALFFNILLDINECALSSCQKGEVCINTLGSFQCAPGCGPLKSWRNYDCVGKGQQYFKQPCSAEQLLF